MLNKHKDSVVNDDAIVIDPSSVFFGKVGQVIEDHREESKSVTVSFKDESSYGFHVGSERLPGDLDSLPQVLIVPGACAFIWTDNLESKKDGLLSIQKSWIAETHTDKKLLLANKFCALAQKTGADLDVETPWLSHPTAYKYLELRNAIRCRIIQGGAAHELREFIPEGYDPLAFNASPINIPPLSHAKMAEGWN